jgi:hypothetical protein
LDLKALDTAIAMIIVLLVLSLVVQSIQSVIKKWFKMKSRSVLDSLTDLLNYVDRAGETRSAEKLVEEIQGELKKLGRVSLIMKNPVVDSITKDDLMKLLDRINASSLKGSVEVWYDTVMQSFEERYLRHMKSVAIVISVVVVIFLNANFFQIYTNISTNDVLRNAIIAKQSEIQDRLRLQPANQPAGTQTPDEVEQQLKGELKQLQETLDESTTFGLQPFKWSQVKDFFAGTGPWTGHTNERLTYLVKALSGWAIMIMLLSVGAPFWQDALESLFGVKTLLQKKAATRPGEEDSNGQ